MVSIPISLECCKNSMCSVFVAIVLSIIAIHSTSHSDNNHHHPITPSSSLDDSSSSSSSSCATNASISTTLIHALQESGHDMVAELIRQMSLQQEEKEEECLIINPLLHEATIFAIADPAFHHFSLSPMSNLYFLRYHISPLKLVFRDLLQVPPQSSCLPTLLPNKNLLITGIDPNKRMVEINGVPISHPDIYTDGHYAIHGILAPFYTPTPQDIYHGYLFIPDSDSSLCNNTSSPPATDAHHPSLRNISPAQPPDATKKRDADDSSLRNTSPALPPDTT